MYRLQKIPGPPSDLAYHKRPSGENLFLYLKEIELCSICEIVYIRRPREICDLCCSRGDTRGIVQEVEAKVTRAKERAIEREKFLLACGDSFIAFIFSDSTLTLQQVVKKRRFTVQEFSNTRQLEKTTTYEDAVDATEDPRPSGTHISERTLPSGKIVEEEVMIVETLVYIFLRPEGPFARLLGATFEQGDLTSTDQSKLKLIYTLIRTTPEYSMRQNNLTQTYFTNLGTKLSAYYDYCDSRELDAKDETNLYKFLE